MGTERVGAELGVGPARAGKFLAADPVFGEVVEEAAWEGAYWSIQ